MAAVFYAVNVPFSKIFLKYIPPTIMAAFLYLGAGLGIGILSLFHKKDDGQSEKLSKKDLSFEGTGSFQFSYGSLFVIMATVCWGVRITAQEIFHQKAHMRL